MPAETPAADKALILAFAKGDKTLQDQAVAAHRRNISTVGVRGDAFQQFMAEIDNPSPDRALRESYRKRVLSTETATR